MTDSASNRTLKDHLKYFGPGMLIVVLSFVVAFLYIKPAPPQNIIIGTGGSRGAYFRFGQEFRIIKKINCETFVNFTSDRHSK
ncbi:hypothetical protein ACFL7E_00330 [Thermodesulfobacteriota bacterium]